MPEAEKDHGMMINPLAAKYGGFGYLR